MTSSTKFSKFFLAMCLAVLPLMACAQEEAPQAEQSQSTTFHPLAIHSETGAHLFQVEAALTPAEHERGLMFREQLADDHGMLFVFDERRPVSFWMKNTFIPLDMIFIDRGGVILHIHEMAKPHDESAAPSLKPVIAVLEIPGGQAAKRGIHIGDTVETPLLAGNTP